MFQIKETEPNSPQMPFVSPFGFGMSKDNDGNGFAFSFNSNKMNVNDDGTESIDSNAPQFVSQYKHKESDTPFQLLAKDNNGNAQFDMSFQNFQMPIKSNVSVQKQCAEPVNTQLIVPQQYVHNQSATIQKELFNSNKENQIKYFNKNIGFANESSPKMSSDFENFMRKFTAPKTQTSNVPKPVTDTFNYLKNSLEVKDSPKGDDRSDVMYCSGDERVRIMSEIERIQLWHHRKDIECKDKDKKIMEYQKRINDLSRIIKETENKNSTLIRELNDERNEGNAIVAKTQDVRQIYTLMKNYMIEICERIDKTDEIRDSFETINQNRIDEINGFMKKFSDEEMAFKEQVNHLKGIVNIELTNRTKLEETLKEKDNQICVMFEQKLKIQESFNTEKEQCLKLEEMIRNRDSEIDNLKAITCDKEIAIKDADERMSELIEEHITKEQEFKENIETKDVIIEEKSHDIDRITLELNDCNECKDNLKNQLKSVSEVLNEKIQQLDEMSKRYDQIYEKYNDVSSKLHSLTDEKIQLEKERDQLIMSIEEERERLTNELSLKNNEISQLNEQMIQLKNGFDESICESKCFEAELNGTVQLLNDEKISLEKRVNELKDEIEMKRAEENEMREKLEHIMKDLQLLTKLYDQTKRLMSEKSDEFYQKEQNLAIQINQLKDKCEEISNEKAEFQNRIQILEESIIKVKKDANHEMKQLKNEKDYEIESLNEKLNSTIAERERYKNDMTRERRSLDNQIENMNSILECCKSDYKNRIDDKEEQIKDLKNEVSSLKNVIVKSEEKNECLSRQLQDLTIHALKNPAQNSEYMITPKKLISPVEVSRTPSFANSPNLVSSTPLRYLANERTPIQKFNSFDDIVLQNKVSGSFKDAQKESIKHKSDEKAKPKTAVITQIPKKRQYRRKIIETDSVTSAESYELCDGKLKKVSSKPIHLKSKIANDTKMKTHSKRPIAIDMSSLNVIDERNANDEYDISTVDYPNSAEPLKKKPKENVKKIWKHPPRAANILKGRPTPSKNADLSWFDIN